MQWKRIRSGMFLVQAGLLLAGFLYPYQALANTVFTNDTTIAAGNTDYEGSNIVVRGCTLTVEGEHDFSSLTVTNAGTTTADTNLNLISLTLDGSTFNLAGGAVLSVSNAVILVNTSTLLAQAIDTDAQVASNWVGQGVTITVGSLTVESGSKISADAQGYAGGSGDSSLGKGPGGGGEGSSRAGGGAYGGDGGTYQTGIGGVSYGSSIAPTNLGSGGASDGTSRYGGRGGGAIRLIVDGTLVLDGNISANGQTRSSSYEAGGAGGALWVTADTLTGSGAFVADGGANVYGSGSYAGGGGGGRIAVYYGNDAGYSGFTNSSATGGDAYSSYDGHTGTVAFFDTSVANHHLSVYQRFELPSGSNTYGAIMLEDAATMSVGTSSVLNVDGAFNLIGGSTFNFGGGSALTVGGTLSFSNSSIFLAQAIDTDTQVASNWVGQGVTINAENLTVESGSMISADAQGYAGGSGDSSPGKGPGGGGEGSSRAGGGGYGGDGGTYQSGIGGVSYGSSIAPTNLGSGGASDGSSRYGGRGGGAIRLIVGGTLALDGTISANGQIRSSSSYEAAGAGGALWVMASTLTGSGSFVADGGANTYGSSAYAAGGGGGRIAVYSENDVGYSGFTNSIATGGDAYGSADGHTGTVAFFDTSVIQNHLAVYQRFELPSGSNTYGAITLDDSATMSVGTGSVLNVDGAFHLDGGSTFNFGGGSALTVGGTLSLSNASTFLAQAIDTDVQVASNWVGQGVTITVSNLTVESGSMISADAQGYAGGSGVDSPGKGPGGGGQGSSCAGGGGYGGNGGTYNSGIGGISYGSSIAPTNLGSGGASDNSSRYGGRGGGAIRLIVGGTLALDGTISANGQIRSSSSYEAAGAGGALWVTASTLTGSGSFVADGGANTYGSGSYASGGGGGRIAVYYGNDAGYSGFTNSTVSRGDAYGSADGYVGTAAFFDTSVPNHHLTVVQNFIPVPDGTHFGAITLLNGATMTLGESLSLTVDGHLWISGNSTLMLHGSNTFGQVGGEWVGQGVSVRAGSVTVETGSEIHADGCGYTGKSQSPGNGPGAGDVASNAAGGAGHGGIGGDGYSSTSGGGTYGSENRPAHLGSGGGGGTASSSSTVGGTGGGALRLIVDGTLTLDGTISANGNSTADSYCSGGSGGSLWVDANELAGSGSFLANGGNGGYQAGGGGCGRIAIYYWSSLSWPTGNVSLAGGTGYRSGSSGQAIIAQESDGYGWWDRSEITATSFAADDFSFDADCPTTGWSNIVESCSNLWSTTQQWQRVDGFVTTEPDVYWSVPVSNGTRQLYYRLRSVNLE